MNLQGTGPEPTEESTPVRPPSSLTRPGVREYAPPRGHSLRYVGRADDGTPRYQCECGEMPEGQTGRPGQGDGRPGHARNWVKRWHSQHCTAAVSSSGGVS